MVAEPAEAGQTPVRMVARARALLRAGEGYTRKATAAALDVGPATVRRGSEALCGRGAGAGSEGTTTTGSRHGEEIINEYAGEEFEVKEPLLLISIGVKLLQAGRSL